MREDESWGRPGEEAWEQTPEEEAWHAGHGHRRGRGRGPGRGQGGPFGARRGYGPPPWMAALHEFGMSGGGPGFRRGPDGMRGPRARRGDVRAAALALLAEEPRNGYQIIQEIRERSGGLWQPSPGSVYPALAQLEDEGLIEAETPEGGKRRYKLSAEGEAYVAAHPDEVRAPWDDVAGSVGSEAIELRRLFGQVVMAAVQVVKVGNESQVAQARQILSETRRRLYQILAADDDTAQE